jgi:hypothetical protein
LNSRRFAAVFVTAYVTCVALCLAMLALGTSEKYGPLASFVVVVTPVGGCAYVVWALSLGVSRSILASALFLVVTYLSIFFFGLWMLAGVFGLYF